MIDAKLITEESLAIYKNIEMTLTSTKLSVKDALTLLSDEKYMICFDKSKYYIVKDAFKQQFKFEQIKECV